MNNYENVFENGLPRKKNWDQFKKAKKKIGNDIGDETAHIGAKSAKMVSIGASTDRKVSTYEEFVSGENDSIWDMGKRKEQYKKVEESNVIRDLQDDFSDKNVKETKDKIKMFNGGNKGPGDISLYGDTNVRQTLNPQNRTLDLLRIGKQVIFNGWEGFVDKIEGDTVFIRERISGKYHSMTMKEFFKSVKPDEFLNKIEKPKKGKTNESQYIVKFDDMIGENMLPKLVPQVQCLECGEFCDNDYEDKIWHLQNIHNIKPDEDDHQIKNALRDYFAI